MSTYIFDTDHLSYYQVGHPKVIRRVALHATHNLAITVITVHEMIGGWLQALSQARSDTRREDVYRRMAQAARTIGEWTIFPFPLSAMARHADLMHQRLNVGSHDLRIAAIALELGAVVVTRNRRDFSRVQGLIIEDWTA